SALHQGKRDDVLAVDVGHRAIIDDAGAILRKPDDDPLHVVNSQLVLAKKREERIQRSLNRIADGEGLDGGFGDEKACAQPSDDSSGFGSVDSAMSALCSPSSTSHTPVNPICIMIAAVPPLRPPMPEKWKPSSTCPAS